MKESKSCINCKFSEQAPITKDTIGMNRPYFCKRFPPQMYTVFGPEGVALNVQFPIVNKDIHCFEHDFKIELNS